MNDNKSKVYICLDGEKIIRCEGGYTVGNITDAAQWVYIDEGEGDRYNLCQTHYFAGGLRTDDGLCRWKYADGECVLRSNAEIEAERAAIQPPTTEPSTEDMLLDMVADLQMQVCMIQMGGEMNDI